MLTADELAAMRDTIEAALPDTIVITRPAAPQDGTLNTTTGALVPAASTPIFSGACRVRAQQNLQQASPGEDHTVITQYICTIAEVDPFTVRQGDWAVVTSADSADPGSFRVLDVAHQSWNLGWRLTLERIEK